jgi:hypothetical protein
MRKHKWRFWLKPAFNYSISPLAEANGNEKNHFLSLPSHLCNGLKKKNNNGFSQKACFPWKVKGKRGKAVLHKKNSDGF